MDDIKMKRVKGRTSANSVSFTIPVEEYKKLPQFFYADVEFTNIKRRKKHKDVNKNDW